MVLYHCCASRATAQAIERAGFNPGELVAVKEKAPGMLGRNPSKAHAIIVLGLPFSFILDKYPVVQGKTAGTVERLIPGSLLNRFPRVVWPD